MNYMCILILTKPLFEILVYLHESVHVSTLFPKTTSDLHLLRAYDYVMLQNKARYNEGDGKD